MKKTLIVLLLSVMILSYSFGFEKVGLFYKASEGDYGLNMHTKYIMPVLKDFGVDYELINIERYMETHGDFSEFSGIVSFYDSTEKRAFWKTYLENQAIFHLRADLCVRPHKINSFDILGYYSINPVFSVQPFYYSGVLKGARKYLENLKDYLSDGGIYYFFNSIGAFSNGKDYLEQKWINGPLNLMGVQYSNNWQKLVSYQYHTLYPVLNS